MERIADDAEFDLALFRVPDLVSPVAPFRIASAGLRTGENLVVVGYPARRMLGAVTVASSAVTATTGPGGDQNRFQFQSGGVEEPWGAPVYDSSGLVVGISNDPQFTGRPGTMLRWYGVNWIENPLLTGTGTNLEKCYMFHRNAIGHAVDTKGLQSPVGYDEEQDYSFARVSGYFGSKLLQNSGVVQMKHDGSAYVAS